jgi:subtilisin-like proprotein convertase family protein
VKKLLLTLSTNLLIGSLLVAQIAYSPLVDSLKNEITEPTLTTMLEQLSGEVEVTIGGQPYTLVTRHSYTALNPKAAEWIYEQFEAMDLQVEYHYFNTDGENVVATITGSEFPDQQYIICAHYDDMPPGNFAPGADDNASGVIGVLETARLLKDLDLKYTVKFIAFDEEEQGLIGSNAYANEAAAAGDDILGVLNLDMIAYDSDDDFEMSISTESGSAEFTAEYTSVLGVYDFDLSYNFITTGASDHSPFWNNGYQAILAIEDWNDFNDAYHTTGDVIENCNIPYFKQMVQSAVATMASLSMDMKMELIHEPLLSGNSTADREAWLVVNSSYTVGTGDASPRLYYSVDGSGFTALQPVSTNLDTFFFMIPGQVMGSTVEYYLAAQNEDATLVATLPTGGKGIDPPGSIAPESFFSYMVDDIYAMSECSQTTPKNIEDLNHLYDTIAIDHTGTLVDVNVSLDITHTYCGDVEISLIGPDGTEVDLSIGNGGSGNNFTGTIFDDDASTPISAGSAPFTGSYQPDQPLSTLSGKPINGNWVLHIYDNAMNDQGVLLDWCMDILYSGDPVSIPKQQKTLLTVYQNYPNPFSENTTFSFDLDTPGSVKISVLDMLGRSLKTVTERDFEAGSHSVRWNAGSLPGGQYFYKVQTNENVAVKPMLIIK